MSFGDRFISAVADVVRAILPRAPYAHVYEYHVVAQSIVGDGIGMVFDLRPASAHGMPELTGVPMRPGLAGSRMTLVPGTSVLVAFVNGDPSRPFISDAGEADESGTVPTAVKIQSKGDLTIDADDDVDIGTSADGVKLGGVDSTVVDATTAVGHHVCFGDTVTVGTQTGPITKVAPFTVGKARR